MEKLTVYQTWAKAARLSKPNLDHLPERCRKYCGPATRATLNGYWIYPPFNATVSLGSQGTWQIDHEDLPPIPQEAAIPFAYGMAEPDVLQVYSGLVFEAPPGFMTQIRPAVNYGYEQPYRLQECLIERWLLIPVYLNIKVAYGSSFQLRSDVPIGQVACLPDQKQPPVTTNPAAPERVWEFIRQYSEAKLTPTDEYPKNSRVYHQTRREKRCPFRS